MRLSLSQSNALPVCCSLWGVHAWVGPQSFLHMCCAGYQVAKDAFGGAFTSENLSIGRQRWRLKRGAREGRSLLPPACAGQVPQRQDGCGQQGCRRMLQP